MPAISHITAPPPNRPFAGPFANDAFAIAANKETTVTIDLPTISWPDGLGPTPKPFADHAPGSVISGPLSEQCDVLVLLYTTFEIQALLDVFTNNPAWTAARQKSWYGYAHNFDKFKSIIQGIDDDTALKDGLFGYVFPLMVGETRVVLYKTELHPKTNGTGLPFIPVIQQLVSELQPKLVISTGTAGGIGSHIQCGDVVITDAARLHCKLNYPKYPAIDTLSKNNTQLTNTVTVNDKYVAYAAQNFTKLSLPGLAKCYAEFATRQGYSFLKKNSSAPSIYVKGVNPVPGPQPMDIVSADYLTVDDNNDSEGLQSLGTMNDTDDAFAFYAINQLSGTKTNWLSIRNASEPQVDVPKFPPGTSPTQVVDKLKTLAGAIYGVYQYCTTLNSAFACWGVIAGM
jgi:Phosphorylase superfamily